MKYPTLISLGVFLLLGACNPSISKNDKKIEGELMHTVIIWLKHQSELDQSISDGIKLMEDIDEIKTYYVGKPAMTPREIVDNSFSYFITMTFDNTADMNAYLENPLHIAFVKSQKPNWEKVKIYDVLKD